MNEIILTNYKTLHPDMLMDIRILKMNAGESYKILKAEEETAVLLQKGKITLLWDSEEKTVSRKDVFTEGPWCLHVSAGTGIKIGVLTDDTTVLIQNTHNDKKFPAKLYSPDDAPWNDVCPGKFGDTANRKVNTIFDYNNAPYSNMVLGEVINDRGNWSAYIPHHHPQPEVYYYLFDRPEGFGASFIGDEVFKITDGSISAIPGGLTHPQVCAPGYQMYTCWMIRHLPNNPWTTRIDDPRYTWLYDAEF